MLLIALIAIYFNLNLIDLFFYSSIKLYHQQGTCCRQDKPSRLTLRVCTSRTYRAPACYINSIFAYIFFHYLSLIYNLLILHFKSRVPAAGTLLRSDINNQFPIINKHKQGTCGRQDGTSRTRTQFGRTAGSSLTGLLRVYRAPVAGTLLWLLISLLFKMKNQ